MSHEPCPDCGLLDECECEERFACEWCGHEVAESGLSDMAGSVCVACHAEHFAECRKCDETCERADLVSGLCPDCVDELDELKARRHKLHKELADVDAQIDMFPVGA